MATPDYEETEIQDLLQPPSSSKVFKQGNCLPPSVLKRSGSSKNQLSVTILDLVPSPYSDNEDQKSFLSNFSASGTDYGIKPAISKERRSSSSSQKETLFSSKLLHCYNYCSSLFWNSFIMMALLCSLLVTSK